MLVVVGVVNEFRACHHDDPTPREIVIAILLLLW
jgi:hypothetical protein